MYLKTPKRYSGRGRRRYNLFSCRSLLLWTIVPLLIVVLIGIYENSEMFIPRVSSFVEGTVNDAEDRIGEISAPAPTPTRDPTGDLQRAMDAWQRGSIQEAVNLFRRVIDAVPNDVQIHYYLALGLIMQGELEEALVASENAITANPFSPDAWAIKAMALNRLNRSGEAIANAQHALELVTLGDVEDNPALASSRARAQAFLAEAYLESGLTERAQAVVNQALDTDPDSFEAYQVRGRVNQEVNFDLEAARQDFRVAYDIAPNLIYLGIWVARIEQLGFQNNEVAVEIYQDIAERNPENIQVLLALGDYYLRVDGNLTEASSYLSRCINVEPDNAECHYLLGRTLERDEQLIAAQESFQMAIDLEPQAAVYYWWHASTNRDLGQCPQAMPYLQTGYQIAQSDGDTGLMGDFEFLFGECGSPIGGAEATPEITPEPTSDTNSETVGNEA